VVGYSPRPAEGIQALKAGAATELADSPEQAVRDVDLAVLAVPPSATIDLIAPVGSALPAGAYLTDVCSVKGPVVQQACVAGIGDRFAGSHPLAGTHESGFNAARPDRLRGCVVYVCESGTPQGHRAATAVAGFWRQTLEASPVLIGAETHDRQLAWTSHLAQSVASAVAKVLADQGLAGVSFGSGTRDTTRLAASDPGMWADILLLNRDAVGHALSRSEEAIAELRRLLESGNAAALRAYLETAQAFRQGIDR
jgi:prephenate dehydrogenase